MPYEYCRVMCKQGALLTEYTLRLIGSDIEHYIKEAAV
jgi:hypothetical protein